MIKIILICSLVFLMNFAIGFQMVLDDVIFKSFFNSLYPRNNKMLTTTPTTVCVNKWQDYTGTEDISMEGILAGSFDSHPVYVGKAVIRGSYGPVTIHLSPNGGYCIYIENKNTCIKDFQFLKKVQTYQYDWVASRNGDQVANAIDGTKGIGRIAKDLLTSVGSVKFMNGFDFINQSTLSIDFVTDGYEVLTCIDMGSVTTVPTVMTTTREEKETTMDTTTMEPEETTTIETTNEPNYDCTFHFKSYTGKEDISKIGVQAGTFNSNPIYVGVIGIYGVYLSGAIFNDPSGGYYMHNGLGNFTKLFYFLHELNKFRYSWVESKNGQREQNSVDISFQIGKVTKNGNDFVGNTILDIGFIYMNESSPSWHFIDKNYQVLTCYDPNIVYPTTPIPPSLPDYYPRQSCNHSWIEYTGQENLSLDGVIAGTKGKYQTYVGLVNVSGSMLLGQVRRKSAKKYCIDIGDIKCSNKFQYLRKNQLYYAWRSSLDSKYYKYLAGIRYYHLAFPIGRVGWKDQNSTIGLTIDANIMAYLKESTYNWYIDNGSNQVLLCSPDSEIFTESTDLTTTVEPEDTTTEEIDTTTNEEALITTPAPQTCNNCWIDYMGSENLAKNAVYAGQHESKPVYIGRTYNSGLFIPGAIIQTSKDKFCLHNENNDCIDEFQYLYNFDANNYKWIKSSHGKYVKNAVIISNPFLSYAIGRVVKKDKILIGVVNNGTGLVIFSEFMYTNYENYEVLVCSRKDDSETTTFSIESSTTNFETTTTPEIETTTQETDTTTNIRPEVKDDIWIEYTGTQDLYKLGVYADRQNSKFTFVGKINISGLVVPEIIYQNSKTTYCIQVHKGNCEDKFQFLSRTDEFNYKWIDSKDGIYESNAVYIDNIFGSFVIGRVEKNKRTVLGLVYPDHGLVINQKTHDFIKLYDLIYNHFIKNDYQVLVRTDDEEETTIPGEESTTVPIDVSSTTVPYPQNCANLWKQYSGNNDLSNEAVLVGISDSHPVYLGRTKISNNLIPSTVYPRSLSYCISINNIECSEEFEYLTKSIDYDYIWVNSHHGQDVKNSVQNVIFSVPLAIGKFEENDQLFVGLVVPGVGLAFLNESTYNWYIAKTGYQVLTCSEAIVTTTTEVKESTTTPVHIYYCAEVWLNYTGVENIASDGVFAGLYDSNSIYVGKIFNSTNYHPVRIQADQNSGYCVKDDGGDCRTDFSFLRKPVDLIYNWIESAKGELQENDVRMGKTGTVARVVKNGNTHIGMVYPKAGFMSYNTEFIFVTDGYEVLRCFDNFYTKTSIETSTPDTTMPFSIDTTTTIPADTSTIPADTTTIPADTTIIPADTTTIPADTTTIPADKTTISTTKTSPSTTLSILTLPTTTTVPTATTIPFTPPTSGNSNYDVTLKDIYKVINQNFGLIIDIEQSRNRIIFAVTIIFDAAQQASNHINKLIVLCQQRKCGRKYLA